MKKVIICWGLPASGKSTWAKTLVADNPGQYKRINKDDLRAMLDVSHYTKANEKFIERSRDTLILASLAAGKSVIVDDTNLAPRHEAHIRQLVKTYCEETGQQVQVVVQKFEVDLEECIRRDLKRTRSVGERVIKDMYRRHILVRTKRERYCQQDESLPPAVIFDIDGTLAIIGDRSPYRGEDCAVDIPNQPVIRILNRYRYSTPSPTIFLFSGRNGESQPQTEQWLGDHGVFYDHLVMRPPGNMEKDSKIKREFYETHVKGKFFVEAIYDDRNQVVAMWRELGLLVCQVYPGDF